MEKQSKQVLEGVLGLISGGQSVHGLCLPSAARKPRECVPHTTSDCYAVHTTPQSSPLHPWFVYTISLYSSSLLLISVEQSPQGC